MKLFLNSKCNLFLFLLTFVTIHSAFSRERCIQTDDYQVYCGEDMGHHYRPHHHQRKPHWEAPPPPSPGWGPPPAPVYSRPGWGPPPAPAYRPGWEPPPEADYDYSRDFETPVYTAPAVPIRAGVKLCLDFRGSAIYTRACGTSGF